MKRRTYLGASGIGALSTLAGCLDSLGAIGAGDGSDETVLDPPEQTRGEPIHPIHGDPIPAYSVPDALSGETVSDEDFRDERAQLYTFVYTNCVMGACPAMLQQLVTVNLAVRDEGYRDEAAFLPVTFDPERDTTEVLRNYVTNFGIDRTADDWYFLRPETYEAAEELVMTPKSEGGFGLPIEKAPVEELTGDDGGDNESDGNTSSSTDLEYGFTHYALILLVNEQGIVERSYPNATSVPPSRIQDDMLTVLEG